MLRKLDDFLIDEVFQKLSEKYQLWTFRTNFHLAIIFFIAYYIVDIPKSVHDIIELKTATEKFLYLFLCLIAYGIIYFNIQRCKSLDALHKEKSDLASFNPLRINDFAFRCFFAIFSIYIIGSYIMQFFFDVQILHLLNIIRIFSLIFAFYFMACVPVPPKKLRELEKEKALSLKLEPAKVEL